MKKILYLIIIFVNVNLKAQDGYFSYNLNRYLFLNPAEAGASAYPRISAAYRNQWPGVGNTFATYAAGFDTHFAKSKTSIGINFMYDKQGAAFSKGNFDILYAYRFVSTSKLTMQLGFQAGFLQWSRNGITLTDLAGNNDVVVAKTYIQPDFAIGFVGYNRNLNFGLAAHHLNTGFIKLGPDFHSQTLSFTAYYMPKIRYYTTSIKKNEYVFSPLLLANVQIPYTIIQYGLVVEHSGIEVGAGLRHKQFLPGSLIFKAGVQLGNLKITYNYDFNMQFATYSLPLSECHEIGLIYYFIDNERKKPTGPVKCPNFN